MCTVRSHTGCSASQEGSIRCRVTYSSPGDQREHIPAITDECPCSEAMYLWLALPVQIWIGMARKSILPDCKQWAILLWFILNTDSPSQKATCVLMLAPPSSGGSLELLNYPRTIMIFAVKFPGLSTKGMPLLEPSHYQWLLVGYVLLKRWWYWCMLWSMYMESNPKPKESGTAISTATCAHPRRDAHLQVSKESCG